MTIAKGTRVEFENGQDRLRGVVHARHEDPKRPDMEETWTVFADSALVRTPILDASGRQRRSPGVPRVGRDGKPILDTRGKPKLTDGEPIFEEKWVTLVGSDGLQKCDDSGNALHKNFGGEPLQLVKHGVPVPFRVRARRMTEL